MRQITLTVQGDTVQASRDRAGVRGEGNATGLVVTFDPGWDGYAKTITFWDAVQEHPVARTLTADLLVEGQARTYRTTIPPEPLALAGECRLVIDGYQDGVRARSMSLGLTVEDAPMTDDAGQPADPTPTQAEQLQVQIEAILGDIQQVAQAADGAQRAQQAARSAELSAGAAAQWEEGAKNWATSASAYEQGAKAHREGAEQAAALARGYTSHPPVIGDNGTWWEWDGVEYADTGLPSRGADGKDGTDGKDGETGPAGRDGANGADGHTPVRGVDYFTAEDVADMVAATKAQIAAGERYEKIESIETTEEVNEIKRTVEPDGTAYHFKRIMVNIYCPAGSAAGMYVWNGAGVQIGFISNAVNTGERYSRLTVDVSRGYIEGVYTAAGSRNAYPNMTAVAPSVFRAMSVLDGIRFTGATFPVGTKIDIYGVRA